MNASDAVIRLDVPMVKPDQNPELLVLHPSYASAVKGAEGTVLPSVNMIDGKAKQFDDGLYAAIDQAYFLGHGEAMKGHLQTIRRILDKVAKGSPAADYLAAGLSLGAEPVEVVVRRRRRSRPSSSRKRSCPSRSASTPGTRRSPTASGSSATSPGRSTDDVDPGRDRPRPPRGQGPPRRLRQGVLPSTPG